MIGIYKLTSPSGKSYIGQSLNIDVRLHHYKLLMARSQIKLYRALLKYGFENFSIEILKIIEDYVSRSKLKILLDGYEIYFIKKYDTINAGYNIREGGSRGKLSSEAKNKISIANKDRVFSKEHRRRLSESHTGYIMPKSQKDLISIKSKLKGISPETREKMVKSRKGYKPTKETLAKSSKSHIKDKVLQLDLVGNLIKEWECVVYASRELGYSRSCIYDCCNNKRKVHKGFIWKYKSNIN
jgi:group I intron endonuclease